MVVVVVVVIVVGGAGGGAGVVAGGGMLGSREEADNIVQAKFQEARSAWYKRHLVHVVSRRVMVGKLLCSSKCNCHLGSNPKP